MKFQLGSDPELMLVSSKTKELVSAIPIIQEGKGAGRPLDKSGMNAVLHDNVLVEFNTKPAETEKEFVDTIGSVLKSISDIVKKDGLELHLQASAEFPEKELNCEEAKIFGCDPDFNAWSLTDNKVPAGAAEKPFRSAGGHLHIGTYPGEDALNAILEDDYGKVDVVKALDIFCGIPSIFLDKDPTAPARRALYGGAGAHRPKPYGVEYRALGNWWLRSPDYVKLVYRLTKAGLTCLVEGKLPGLIKAIGEDKIQEIIDESKTKEAVKVYNKFIVPHLPEKLVDKVDSLFISKVPEFSKSWKI